MDFDGILAYLESPFIRPLYAYSEDEKVVDAWKRIIERLLGKLYNNGDPLAEKEMWKFYRKAIEDIGRYDFAIFTEERDELCEILVTIANLASLVPPDGASIDQWIDQHRSW